MKVRTKLIAILVILVGAIIGTGALSVVTISQSIQQSNLLQDKMELQQNMKQLEFLLAGLSNDERGYLLTGDADYAEGMQKKIKEIQSTQTLVQQSSASTPYTTDIQTIDSTFTKILDLNTKMLSLRTTDLNAAEDVHFGEERTLRKQVLSPAVDNVVSLLQTEVQQLKQAADEQAHQRNFILLAVIAVTSLVGIVLGILLLRSILKPLHLLNTQMNAIAEGEADLTRRIDIRQKDEFGALANSFNRFVASLRDIVSQIGASSEMVAASAEQFSASAGQSKATSGQVAESMQVIADKAGYQTRQLERNTAALQTSLDKLSAISTNTTSMADFSRNMRDQAESGEQSISKVGQQMTSIHHSVLQTDQSVDTLASHAAQIDTMTTLINQIATQTNLLALNAAIEAARAGEHGSGFAVVADEVRKLAEQSADAASQIKELVVRIQTETQSAQSYIQMVKEEVQTGTELTGTTVQQFRQIVTAAEQISDQTRQIADNAVQMNRDFTDSSLMLQEVNAGTRDISGSTEEIAAATEQQLASSEEILHSAASLTTLATELQTLVHRFKVAE
ncbi:methyl-accepting chemotaxis protein [Paenibacillus sp. WLX1005]|uniref:methyl-accepting chemotaxis protein n=1 Tax=Paenibacillus sp. WLX1005 TaxID=3243766 RepID=UPI003983E0DE